MLALFNNWDQGQLLQVGLQKSSSLLYDTRAVRWLCDSLSIEVEGYLVIEDNGACWVLDVGVHIDERLMKLTERFVPAANLPGFTVKSYLEDVLSILL